MNNEPVAWKAYEEVHFNDQYILRWVREGDEYVNKITKEMMEDLKSVVRQQQAELDRAVELYTDKAIENEALKQIIDANNLNQNIGQFVKPINEPVAWMLADKKAKHIRSIMAVQHDFVPEGCVEIPLYTHPYKPSKSEVDALLDNADYVVGIMCKEIEEWKRKYKDMHNLATQAMSKVHQLEKEAQEK